MGGGGREREREREREGGGRERERERGGGERHTTNILYKHHKYMHHGELDSA